METFKTVKEAVELGLTVYDLKHMSISQLKGVYYELNDRLAFAMLRGSSSEYKEWLRTQMALARDEIKIREKEL